MSYTVITRTPIAETPEGKSLYDRANHETPDVQIETIPSLDETREQVADKIDTLDVYTDKHSDRRDWTACIYRAQGLPEEGGTITLPNGVLIEVKCA